ncbi:metallophosphoesterase family protein (plasmid) [Sulfitobacter faviae]|uniref:Metallophosphoesterase family protein n=1 Tax=Sulfitobacter faviae TaxID=1775881 RepID=A0ABZ0V6H9_9RHOB|nr:metallophosphoesterase family protein [Sulfitobacter faviae]WPZ23576.1 metallophosphoesterase family protein [Sulfitobacter faviae]
MRAEITSWLKGWIKRSEAEAEGAPDHFAPEAPFFAVGDIHGCAGLLEDLLEKLRAVATGEEVCVFLGDYIDRGPDGRGVLTRLFDLCQSYPEKVVCLMGNHERMMLDFIDDPAGAGLEWLRFGGLETLRSFGLSADKRGLDSAGSIELANALEAALPSGMQEWLRSLPLQWSSGNMHCVHAAMSPKRHPRAQREQALLWGHPKFFSEPREDGVFVVHGHTIVENASISASRVSLDTGAYKTGRMTAARISTGGCIFLQTES